MAIIPQLYNLIEYTLSSDGFNSITIEEPIGWIDDLFEIKRSKKNFSVITKYSTNLTFVLSGATFVTEVFKEKGFDADIVLTKKSIHPTESKLNVNYTAILDGYTYEINKGKVKINTLESKLNSLLTTYKGEDVELENTEALNGNDIGELETKTCLIEGKQLKLVTEWLKYEDLDEVAYAPGLHPVIPLHNTKNSDTQAADVPGNWIALISNDGQVENLFYSIATDDRDLTIERDFDIDLMFTEASQGQPIAGFAELILVTYEDKSGTGGDQWEHLLTETLALSQRVIAGDDSHHKLIFYDRSVKHIVEGQSWGLYLKITSVNELEVYYNKTSQTITEDSFYEATHSKTVLPFELFERLLRIITGRTDLVLVSDYFGRTELGYTEDGAGAYLGIASGFWAREFNEEPLVISFDTAINSYGVVDNISYSIEKNGFTEYIRIEKLDSFFTNKTLRLPNIVSDVKIKTSSDFSFSSIKIGYEKGGDEYEEAVGLDEPNGKHNYTSPITKNEKKFDKTSKIRGDMTGFEFARRKPQKTFGTEDTRYDSFIFFLDMKKGTTYILLQRKWEDDFLTIPKHIYSPETATNLRLSPKQLLVKHGWFIKNCLTKYTDKDIHFISATGNSEMILDGVQENDNYLIDLFDKEKFLNLDIEFSHETSLELSKEVYANIHGIIELFDDEGNKFRFRLFDFSKNKYKGLLVDGL